MTKKTNEAEVLETKASNNGSQAPSTTQSADLEVTNDNSFEEFGGIAEALDLSDNLDQMETKVIMTSEYFKLEKVGDSFRGIFAGLTEITVKDKKTDTLVKLEAVRLINNRQAYVNAGYTLVKQFADGSIKVGQPVQVTYRELKGDTKIYEVAILG